MQFLNPPPWDGEPFVVGDLLKKGGRIARRALQTHPLGFELRLTAGGALHQSQVCRADQEVLDVADRWRAVMGEKGWV